MPSFNHSARSMATSILSHSSSLASCVGTRIFRTGLCLNHSKLSMTVVVFFTCSHMKGPLWLNEWKLSDPCWMLISVSIKMEVRKRRQRWSEPRCKIRVCSLQNENRQMKGLEAYTLTKFLIYNAVPSSPCGGGKSVLIPLGSIVREGKIVP